MHVTEPCIRAAAVLVSHWHAGNTEAVVLLLAEIGSREEAEDLVVGMLLLRDVPIQAVHSMIPWREAS